MRLFYWSITVLLMLAAAVFAIANRDSVTFSLWPLAPPVMAPLFIVVLLTLLCGLLIGLVAAWLLGGRTRRLARERARRIAQLERDLKRLEERVPSTDAPLIESR